MWCKIVLISLLLGLYQVNADEKTNIFSQCSATRHQTKLGYDTYIVTLTCENPISDELDLDQLILDEQNLEVDDSKPHIKPVEPKPIDCYQIFHNQMVSPLRTSHLIVHLKNCFGDYLDSTIPKQFVTTVYLDITFHELKFLRQADFNYEELRILNASHNQISKISNGLFLYAPHLSDIDLSFNCISNVQKNAFSNLHELVYLDLSDNAIERLNENTFANNKNLELLRILRNPIRRIDGNLLIPFASATRIEVTMKHTEEIDISHMPQNISIHFSEDSLQLILHRYVNCTKKIEQNCCCRTDKSDEIVCIYEPITFEFKKNVLNKLIEFNTVGNNLTDIKPLINLIGPSIEILNLSSNPIGSVKAKTFRKFVNLSILDLRNTNITTINFDSFDRLSIPKYNREFKELHLENNPIEIIDCSLFMLMIITSVVSVDYGNVIALDSSCAKDSLEILFDEDTVIFNLNNETDLSIEKEHVKRLKNINVSGNQMDNPKRLFNFFYNIESLDVSKHYIGPLNENTFENCIHLKYLNLSQTNVSNIKLETFHHLLELETLDLSWNNLESVDFSLLLRNFRYLKTLNLEGNRLKEITTITHVAFPRLTTLGISKNDFNCSYLVTFLSEWTEIDLRPNPLGHSIIGGVTCKNE